MLVRGVGGKGISRLVFRVKPMLLVILFYRVHVSSVHTVGVVDDGFLFLSLPLYSMYIYYDNDEYLPDQIYGRS